jgi:hypothetical protein
VAGHQHMVCMSAHSANYNHTTGGQTHNTCMGGALLAAALCTSCSHPAEALAKRCTSHHTHSARYCHATTVPCQWCSPSILEGTARHASLQIRTLRRLLGYDMSQVATAAIWVHLLLHARPRPATACRHTTRGQAEGGQAICTTCNLLTPPHLREQNSIAENSIAEQVTADHHSHAHTPTPACRPHALAPTHGC